MRVLYITEYQGAAVVAQRRHRRNRALGASRKVELFARALRDGGHDVTVLSTGAVSESSFRRYPGFSTAEPACAGAVVHYLAGLDIPRLNLFYAAHQMRTFLASTGPLDAVLLYNLEWIYLREVLRFCNARKVPLLIEYEDDAIEPIPGARFRNWYRRRGRKAVAAARKRAAGVAAVSEELARQLGIENTIVVPGAISADLLKVGSGERDPSRLIYAGSLTADKGVHELLEAVAGISDAALDVVGTGPELEKLRARATERVTVHGEISRAELLALYARAGLAVNPHVMPEAMLGAIFPFKIAEYAAAGLPIVTTPLGRLPEALKPAVVFAESSRPGDLRRAIAAARSDYRDLSDRIAPVRERLAAEYSEEALSRKLTALLEKANR